MSDAPEANAKAEMLQPITVDKHGLFWFTMYWLRFKYRLGEGTPQSAFRIGQMTIHFAKILQRCPGNEPQVRRFNWKSRILIKGSVLLILPFSIAAGLELGAFLRGKASPVGVLAQTHLEVVALSAVFLMLFLGAGMLLWVDLHRELYVLVDRYNAYVAEQAKAKPESPAPPNS